MNGAIKVLDVVIYTNEAELSPSYKIQLKVINGHLHRGDLPLFGGYIRFNIFYVTLCRSKHLLLIYVDPLLMTLYVTTGRIEIIVLWRDIIIYPINKRLYRGNILYLHHPISLKALNWLLSWFQFIIIHWNFIREDCSWTLYSHQLVPIDINIRFQSLTILLGLIQIFWHRITTLLQAQHNHTTYPFSHSNPDAWLTFSLFWIHIHSPPKQQLTTIIIK